MTLSEQDAKLGADTLRMLAVDAVEKARSGHPGMPMGMADVAFLLWHDHLRFDPRHPDWPNRDRFILSAGHGSMLLYGLLHLFGFGLTTEELKEFRQWGSRTPGHPEYGITPGVEVTTGPLGQGFANAVGMALAAKMAAARFNDAEFQAIDHRVYIIASDGDMMEGITAEAASLAGHLKLSNIVCIYDDNNITIEGRVSLAMTEDVGRRFEAYGWRIERIDGHDYRQISAALARAKEEPDRPTLIMARTKIAQGSPGKQDTPDAHGSPLGPEEVAATRRNLGWPEETFHVPERVRTICKARLQELMDCRDLWQNDFLQWQRRNPEKGRLWEQMWSRTLPEELPKELAAVVAGAEGATRSLSGKALQKAAALVPSLVGGSADLEPSTNTWIKEAGGISAGDFSGRNIRFGVREHAMAAMLNGLARYGCFIPYGSTFLVFSDYCRASIRLAALMKLQIVYVFTHDSIFVGEDGPTHQPVEHVSTLRLIPELAVIRPASAAETAAAWGIALERKDGPTALILTRQKLPALAVQASPSRVPIERGGYVVEEGGASPHVVILASGSEMALAVAAGKILREEKIVARVISVPWLEGFMAQPAAYRDAMLPEKVPKVALEAGRGALWAPLLGKRGLFIGIETFGASAPERVMAEQLGLTPELVAQRIALFLAEGQ